MTGRVAVWVLGPVGSGKSTLIAGLAGWAVVSQDRELERLLAEHGVPPDARGHDAGAAARFAALRAEASARTWDGVPALRRSGRPIAYETTGDKPALLAAEVALDREAGYACLGVAVCRPLADCLRQNRGRRRVLPDAVVRASWAAFRHHLEAGAYAAVFGDRHLRVAGAADADLAGWVTAAAGWPAEPGPPTARAAPDGRIDEDR